jgi:hypothetical protein
MVSTSLPQLLLSGVLRLLPCALLRIVIDSVTVLVNECTAALPGRRFCLVM